MGNVLTQIDSGLLLNVYLQPKASRDKVVGVHDHALKIQLTAPPVDGKANEALVKFLSKLLGVARSKITLQKGQSSRRKMLHLAVSNAECSKAIEILNAYL